MKKNILNLLFVLGLILFTGSMFTSCSDSDDPKTEKPSPDPDPEPGPNPENPTPIRWSENEVDGGERGVSIKVTSKDEHNFVFECTPGSKIQSYRMDVYPLCRMYNYLLESVGAGVKATEDEVEDLIIAAIYNSTGSGGYVFNKKNLGDTYAKSEFDWANSKYSQMEIAPGCEYIVVAIGCNDEDGNVPAEVKICHLKTPSLSPVGSPKMDIDVKSSYRKAGIQFVPNDDCKFFFQFCGDSEMIDAYINAYGKAMYVDFMRHWINAAQDALVPKEDLYYVVDFGYTADSKKMITATSIGLDANKTPGEYVRKDFYLKEIPPVEPPKCSMSLSKIGATTVNLKTEIESTCSTLRYRIFEESVWEDDYGNATEEDLLNLGRELAKSGWGVANPNYNDHESFTSTEFQFDLFDNTNHVLAYIGYNIYGEISKVETVRFKTLKLDKTHPQNSQANINFTLSDPKRTSLKLNFDYNEGAVVYYFQYIMTPDLLVPENKSALIEYLLSNDANVNAADDKGRNFSFVLTGLDPGTEYTFAYMAEDWNGVLSEVKLVKASTEAIQAGPNPTMSLRGYMSDLGNFTVQFSMVKDVAKMKYTIIEDTYSASGDYTYKECMLAWKDYCMDHGLPTFNSATQSYMLTASAKRLVAICVPIGENADGSEKIGDLYTVFYDKDKGIITDPSVIFPDAPKTTSKAIKSAKKPIVIKQAKSSANLMKAEPMMSSKAKTSEVTKEETPGAVQVGNTIYVDMKKLGKHPHAK